jgi:NAD(P)-dependent dehydrogenase (short-subunit alcohol dehydrogenase family)
LNKVLDLDGKTILVTGAAKRLGRGIALHLARAGARVLVHYHTSEAAAREVAADCNRATIFQANLEEVGEIRRMFGEVRERVGFLDGLVNNAARFAYKDPLDITEADWDSIHDVNLKATFFCCQQAAILMKQTGGGRIVNMSSLGGLKPWAHHAHYCASKAGVIMLTKALAKAWAPEITVNSVAPGVIPMGNRDETIDRLIKATPAAREGTPDDVASAVEYFLTAPTFITGQILAVDGGLSLR